jgi:two-component system, cell cycle response regulator DivK
VIDNVEQIAGWRVLIVDDEPDNLGVPSKVITHYGGKVQTACNGEEALQMLGTYHPTFILLDLSMPVMDGWTMLGRLRSDPALMNIPVIALTAHAMEVDRERALAVGFDGYISKPFRLDSLLRDITACLEGIDPVRMANG